MSDNKITVRELDEIVAREIEQLCNGNTTHHNLSAISKILSTSVQANAGALRYAKDRGEKPDIPFYKDL